MYIGRTQFFPNLLQDALTLSVEEIRGVARLDKKGIKVYPTEDGTELCINVRIYVVYGSTVADVSYRVQEAVIATANQLTDKKIHQVDIFVCGVDYPHKKAEDEPDNK
jgi:uncharacterized alkaline shock family protein YloU